MTLQPQRLDAVFIIQWESNWHVGSGLGSATVDRQLRRRACGGRGERQPFVPGSQIKGVLRHRCEELARAMGAGGVVSPHAPPGQLPQPLLEQFRPLAECESLVDRLFGTRYQGECLFVEDAVPASGATARSVVHSRTAIDRLTGTARHATLFSTEVAPAEGCTLTGRLAARHPAGVLTQAQDDDGFPYEYALLLASLLTIDCLGADKSVGLGRCTISIKDNRVRWNEHAAYPLEQALKSLDEQEWLEMLSMLREEQNS
jgi:CRISPR/Cas system CSM-associated protein Csm3 (group 7 of RAMP superfamily)